MSENETVMTKMQKVEETLKDSLYKVELLEKLLKTRLLTIEKRDKLETELEEVKEVLKRNEEKLQSLRKENTRSYMVAACIAVALFMLYGLYQIIVQSI